MPDHAAVLDNRNALEALTRRYKGHAPDLMGAKGSYAVLCPLAELPEGLSLLYEVRAANLRQGGEVCFPGGRMEPGETPEVCALRETEEELAIPRETVQLIGPGDFIANQRGFLLRPFLGLVSPEGLSAIRPSPAEVAEVFTVPLSWLKENLPQIWTYSLRPQTPEDFPYERIGIRRDYPWAWGQVEVPVWYWHDRAIWGMTARITLDLLKAL